MAGSGRKSARSPGQIGVERATDYQGCSQYIVGVAGRPVRPAYGRHSTRTAHFNPNGYFDQRFQITIFIYLSMPGAAKSDVFPQKVVPGDAWGWPILGFRYDHPWAGGFSLSLRVFWVFLWKTQCTDGIRPNVLLLNDISITCPYFLECSRIDPVLCFFW